MTVENDCQLRHGFKRPSLMAILSFCRHVPVGGALIGGRRGFGGVFGGLADQGQGRPRRPVHHGDTEDWLTMTINSL